MLKQILHKKPEWIKSIEIYSPLEILDTPKINIICIGRLTDMDDLEELITDIDQIKGQRIKVEVVWRNQD